MPLALGEKGGHLAIVQRDGAEAGTGFRNLDLAHPPRALFRLGEGPHNAECLAARIKIRPAQGEQFVTTRAAADRGDDEKRKRMPMKGNG